MMPTASELTGLVGKQIKLDQSLGCRPDGDGVMFAAHIAQQSGSTATDD